MGFIGILLGKGEINTDRLQGGVPEHGLEGIHIGTIPKEHSGEGVAELVGVTVGDAGALADHADHLR